MFTEVLLGFSRIPFKSQLKLRQFVKAGVARGFRSTPAGNLRLDFDAVERPERSSFNSHYRFFAHEVTEVKALLSLAGLVPPACAMQG